MASDCEDVKRGLPPCLLHEKRPKCAGCGVDILELPPDKRWVSADGSTYYCDRHYLFAKEQE